MKKVLFVAIIATLIAVGCEKTEIINPHLGTEILFSPDLGKLTKAEGDPTTLQNQGFKVTAIMAYDDPYTTSDDDNEFGQIYDNMSNTPFAYTEGAGWAPTQDPKQYWWPGTDKDLVFLAISSAKVGTVIPEDITISPETGNGISMTPYVIEDFVVDAPGASVNPDNDLMIADAVLQNQAENNKVVDLKFRHALSKVEFWFVTNGQNVQNEYPALRLSVNNENISIGGTAEFTVKYKTDANTEVTLTEGYPISCEEDETFTGNVFTTETEGEYTFTASYTVDNKTYISNEVVVTVGDPASPENIVERTANEDITVVVKSIKVADVISKGNLTVTPIWEGNALLSSYYNGLQDKTDTFEWAPSSVAEDKKEYSITSDLILTTEKKNYATWLVIPQTIKEGTNTELKVEIEYTINNREFTSIFPLYTKDLIKWGVNQYIKYTINLSPNLITFNPSVDDWSNPTDVDHNN